MIICIKLGEVKQICLEINKKFGARPVYRKIKFYCETIIDIPYIQLIYTPDCVTSECLFHGSKKHDRKDSKLIDKIDKSDLDKTDVKKNEVANDDGEIIGS